jgi:hypothetical protein
MAKRKNITATAPRGLTPNPDIIQLAVEYACNAQSLLIATDIEAFPDSPEGQARYDAILRREKAALEILATTPATAAEEIICKARLVEYVHQRMFGFGVEAEDMEIRFLARFADDVQTFLTPIIDAAWKSRKAVA